MSLKSFEVIWVSYWAACTIEASPNIVTKVFLGTLWGMQIVVCW